MRTSTIRAIFAALAISGLPSAAGAGPVSLNLGSAKTADAAVSKIQWRGPYWRGYRDGARVYGWRRYAYRNYNGTRVYGWRRYADRPYNGTRVYGWRSDSSSAVPGGCGTYMYWDTSVGHCVDARDKALN